MDIKVKHERKPNLPWNVIDENGFRWRVRSVFQQVADMIQNTLGPYGANTIIEKFGEVHITKDGWQIQKKIHFEDPIDQNIHILLLNISAQVVIKVGDGSTSSIVAANEVLKALESAPELKKIRPKDLVTVLTRCAERIGDEIFASATQINLENDPELNDIYRLAMISTNGDEEISRIIQKIYTETNNPFIEYVKSRTAATHFEIVEGYQAMITYLDPIYANNDEGICNIENPLIMMFDHKLDKETHYDKIIAEARIRATELGRRLVVIAPHYDQFFLNALRTQANIEIKSMGKTSSVFCRVTLINNTFQEHYHDFAVMTGAEIFREVTIDEFLEGKVNIDDYLGEVENISIGPKTTSIRGFYKRNQGMYDVTMRDAVAKYQRVEENNRDMNIVNSEVFELKKRISKLKGRMGIIYVGGSSTLEKTSNIDLVEDAVKACESAYNYGYNIGGNLIIPIVINRILTAYKQREERGEELSHDELLDITVMKILDYAFKNVFGKVLENRYGSEDRQFIKDIVQQSITKEQCYNLITEEYSNDVINPCFTDIEILKAATSIVSLLLTSNQYVSTSVQH